jgi:hypothetical protein
MLRRRPIPALTLVVTLADVRRFAVEVIGSDAKPKRVEFGGERVGLEL